MNNKDITSYYFSVIGTTSFILPEEHPLQKAQQILKMYPQILDRVHVECYLPKVTVAVSQILELKQKVHNIEIVWCI